jgi:DNA polymerase IV
MRSGQQLVPAGIGSPGDVAAIEIKPIEQIMTHPPPPRKIIHIDMDAFFASVEQRDDPSLRGKPVAVGGMGERGVVAAASYEARVFGVRSAMASAKARRLCPDLIFVPHRFEVYRHVSRQIREIFLDYTPLVQPLSLDEAYLDVTENLKGIGSATHIAEEIRARIREVTGLTASAGVSYNKFLAKIASDVNKPDGICVITPAQGPDFAAALLVRKFYGVGPATAGKMEKLGIVLGRDLRDRSREFLDRHFGKAGGYYYWASRGIDHRAVNPNQERKSIGSETTFGRDLVTIEECMAELRPLIASVARHCAKHESGGRTVTLKLRFADFKTVTRSRSHPRAVAEAAAIEEAVAALLQSLTPLRQGVRLLGVTLSNLHGPEGDKPEMPLLDFAGKDQ